MRKLTNVSKNIMYTLKAEHSRRYRNSIVMPREILLAITYKCDSMCKTCGIWKKYLKDPEKSLEELSLEEFKRVVDNNKYLQGIAITGGEPFLREDLYDMVTYLDQKGYSTGITTNAIAVEHIMKETQRILNNLSGEHRFGIQISVDGLDNIHDYIRGVKGNFNNAMMLLKWCMEQSEKYNYFHLAGVSHTLTDSNYQYLDKFIEYFTLLGLTPEQISFRPVSYSSVYYGNTRNSEMIKKNLDLISVIKKIQNKYNYYKEDTFYKGMIQYLRNPDKRTVKCYAGITSCYIDPYLNVYPCIFTNLCMGNLRDYDFDLQSLLSDKKGVMTKKTVQKGNCNCWTKCVTMSSLNSDPFRVLNNYIRKAINFR
ncbi:MAG: radical SAM/SPASM domain-containing protein [Thermodesulfobacteriota bacterium]